jgi:hypothetical protein
MISISMPFLPISVFSILKGGKGLHAILTDLNVVSARLNLNKPREITIVIT